MKRFLSLLAAGVIGIVAVDAAKAQNITAGQTSRTFQAGSITLDDGNTPPHYIRLFAPNNGVYPGTTLDWSIPLPPPISPTPASGFVFKGVTDGTGLTWVNNYASSGVGAWVPTTLPVVTGGGNKNKIARWGGAGADLSATSVLDNASLYDQGSGWVEVGNTIGAGPGAGVLLGVGTTNQFTVDNAGNVATPGNITVNTNKFTVTGATGATSVAGGLNLSGAASPLSLNSSAGTANQVLLSNGAGNTPVWATVNNGLTSNAGTNSFQLGGNLTTPTTIGTSAGNNLTVNGAGNVLLGTGTGNTTLGNSTGTTTITGGATTTITGTTTNINSTGGNTVIGNGTGTTSVTGSNWSINNAGTFTTAAANALNMTSTSPTVSFANTGTLNITDGTNNLLTIADGGTTGNVTATGNFNSNGVTTLGDNTGADNINLNAGTGAVTLNYSPFNTAAASDRMLKAVQGTGVVAPAVAGTDYELPLTFNNGLTRIGNTVVLGGALTSATTVATSAGNNLTVGGNGNFTAGNGSGATSIGTGTGTTSVGNTTAATTVLGNALNLNNSGAGATNIGTGTGAVSIGNTTGGTTITGTTTHVGAVNLSGTTSPLQLNGAAGTANQILTSAGAGNTPTWTSVNNGLTLSGGNLMLGGTLTGATNIANAGNTFSVTGTGVTGIGTSTPFAGSKLDVAGDDASSTPGQLLVTGATSTNKQLMLGYNTTSNYGSIQSINQGVATTPLYLQPAGANVGIGNTSASNLLAVGSSNTAANQFQVSPAGAIANATGVISSGTITFASLNGGGIVKSAAGTGTLSNATAGVDYLATVNHDATLTGLGNTATPLGLNLTNPNTWTGTQTFPATAAQSDAFVNSINGGGTSMINVTHGGTGVGTITQNGVVFGSGTSPVGATAAGTNGQVLIAATGLAPAFGTIGTGTTGSDVNFTTGANTLTLNIPDASTTARGVVTTGTQGFAGAKTFNTTAGNNFTVTGAGAANINNTVGDGATNIGNASSAVGIAGSTANINTAGGTTSIGNAGSVAALRGSSVNINSAAGATNIGNATGATTITGSTNVASLNGGGLVKSAAGTGLLSNAVAGTDYEVPLTFNNGLTRTGNTVALGGALTAPTTVTTSAGNNLTVGGNGNFTAGNGSGTTNLGTGTGATNIGNATGGTAITGPTTATSTGATLNATTTSTTANNFAVRGAVTVGSSNADGVAGKIQTIAANNAATNYAQAGSDGSVASPASTVANNLGAAIVAEGTANATSGATTANYSSGIVIKNGAIAVAGAVQPAGKITGVDFSVAAGSVVTTVKNPLVTSDSYIILTPANAASASGMPYVSTVSNGSFQVSNQLVGNTGGDFFYLVVTPVNH